MVICSPLLFSISFFQLSGMSSRLKQSVPLVWVLLRIVTLVIETSSQFEAQLWLAEPCDFLVILDSNQQEGSLDFSANYCTVQELSWFHGRMSQLSREQKQMWPSSAYVKPIV